MKFKCFHADKGRGKNRGIDYEMSKQDEHVNRETAKQVLNQNDINWRKAS